MENKQVFEVGQTVTGGDLGGKRMVIDEVGVIYTYKLRYPDGRKDTSGRQYYTYQLEAAPKLTKEEAWIDVTLLVGKRSRSPLTWASEAWKRETRHQCYVILGSAGVKMEDDVKERVRKLIARADSEDFDG